MDFEQGEVFRNCAHDEAGIPRHLLTDAQAYGLQFATIPCLLLTICQRLRPPASLLWGLNFYPGAISNDPEVHALGPLPAGAGALGLTHRLERLEALRCIWRQGCVSEE